MGETILEIRHLSKSFGSHEVLRDIDFTVKKGDVLGVARIAGIMATKRTSELIPLCHPLPPDESERGLQASARAAGCGGALHRQDGGRHRRGDGGPDGRFHRPAHHLRYV